MLNGFRTLLLGCITALFMTTPTLAEWQPSGQISIWVGFGAGGSTDALSRAVANSMEKDTGWQIVVENIQGGGVAMLSRLQAAAPDGLSIGIGVTTPVALQLVRRGDQLPFDLQSFDWLTTLGRAGLVLAVSKDSPWQTFDALLEASRVDAVTVGTNGPDQEMILRAIAAHTGGNFIPVPMKSEGEKIQNLLGGHVDAVTPGGAHQEYVASGAMTVVAGLAPIRDPAAPEVATMMEMDIPFAIDARYFVAAPAGLEPEVRNVLHSAFQAALAKPEMQQAMKNMAVVPSSLAPDETRAMMREALVGIRAIANASPK